MGQKIYIFLLSFSEIKLLLIIDNMEKREYNRTDYNKIGVFSRHIIKNLKYRRFLWNLM